jgi:multidrug efflux system membrane fusion protein
MPYDPAVLPPMVKREAAMRTLFGAGVRRATLLGLVGLLPGVYGCGQGGGSVGAAADVAPRQPSGIPVTVATVVDKAMPIVLTAVGAAEAFATVAVRAQVTGELTEVHFADGQEVAKGQVLFALDRRPLEAAVNQAEATLQRDLAQAEYAKSQRERYRGLADRGIASKEQVDQFLTAAAAIDATVAADRAMLDTARLQLAYSTIVAPIAGRAGRLLVNAGNLVRATDNTPLVLIHQVAPIYVAFAIPEGELAQLKRHLAAGALTVEASSPGETGSPARGTVSFVDHAVDPATGTITIRATFANADRRLTPGQFVNVTVNLGIEPTATVVPTAAVQTGQQGAFVFVVTPAQTADLRVVQVSRTAGDDTVVTSGVSAGETIVKEGQLRLAPGSPIVIRPETAAVPR